MLYRKNTVREFSVFCQMYISDSQVPTWVLFKRSASVINYFMSLCNSFSNVQSFLWFIRWWQQNALRENVLNNWIRMFLIIVHSFGAPIEYYCTFYTISRLLNWVRSSVDIFHKDFIESYNIDTLNISKVLHKLCWTFLRISYDAEGI